MTTDCGREKTPTAGCQQPPRSAPCNGSTTEPTCRRCQRARGAISLLLGAPGNSYKGTLCTNSQVFCKPKIFLNQV